MVWLFCTHTNLILSSKSSSWCFGRMINYNLISIISPSGKQKEANPSLVVLHYTNIVMSTCICSFVLLYFKFCWALTYLFAAFLLVFLQKFTRARGSTYAYYLYDNGFSPLDRSIFWSYIIGVYTIIKISR